jgi:hypothetical protein
MGDPKDCRDTEAQVHQVQTLENLHSLEVTSICLVLPCCAPREIPTIQERQAREN